MRRALSVIVVAVALLLVAGGERASAQSCSGSTWCGDYDINSQTCDCANAKLTRMDCVPGAGACGEYNCDGDPGSCWCSGTCNWTGGGGGGSSCPGECRQGSSCGVGYSGASGCSGQGPGGGCKTNQVCCSANSCGSGGGGGGSVACVAPQDCPPGTVKSATVKSAVCQPLCGDNAWGTGGSPGTAQSYTECCQWEETGGGNCVWEPCPTKNNPNKICKVCDPVETWCKKETVTTYECIPSCVAQNPSAVTLVTPLDGANIGGTGVTLDWNAVTSWGGV